MLNKLLIRILALPLLALACLVGLLLGVQAVSAAWTPSEETRTTATDEIGTITVEASPASLEVCRVSHITATVQDPYGHGIPGLDVRITTTLGLLDGEQELWRITDEYGSVTCTVHSTKTGLVTVRFCWIGLGCAETTVCFSPGPPYTLTLEAYPTRLTVGESSTLTATVVDQYSNPVADGTTVNFATTLGTIFDATTTSSGKATAKLASTTIGIAHVTATSGLASDSVEIVFSS